MLSNLPVSLVCFHFLYFLFPSPTPHSCLQFNSHSLSLPRSAFTSKTQTTDSSFCLPESKTNLFFPKYLHSAVLFTHLEISLWLGNSLSLSSLVELCVVLWWWIILVVICFLLESNQSCHCRNRHICLQLQPDNSHQSSWSQ